METKRLIPYSVHLPEDIYKILKQAAGQRKASSLVRDAIIMIASGTTPYNSGYNKGLRDSIKIIQADTTAKGLVINGNKVAAILSDKIDKLIIKEKANGSKKGRGNRDA